MTAAARVAAATGAPMRVTVGRGGDEVVVPANHSVTVVLGDGSEWVIRPSEAAPTSRLEVMLVPGTGPNGESDISLRAVAANRVTAEAVPW